MTPRPSHSTCGTIARLAAACVNRYYYYKMRVLIALFAVLAVAFADVNAAGAADELSNLKFDKIIGGPMTAAIDAQVTSSQQTVAFITKVGMTSGTNGLEVIMVSFNYQQKLNNGTQIDRSMSVPFLYMVPIPYLRIDKLDIDFAVKISSVESTDSAFGIQGVVNASGGSPFGTTGARVDVSGSVSVQYSTKSSATVKRDYSMTIHIECVQAEMPGGMERVLELFENIIQSDNPAL